MRASRMRWILLAASLLPLCPLAQTAPADLDLVRIGGEIPDPVAIRAPHDGSGRLFVVSQRGPIYLLRDGTVAAKPLVTVPVTFNSISGLLGLAFHPNFGRAGLAHADEFYVAAVRSGSEPRLGTSPDLVLLRYHMSADPDVAIPEPTLVLRLASNGAAHFGGDLHFAADGMLVMSTGDGGQQNGTHGFAECLWKKPADGDPSSCGSSSATPQYFLRGKMLRIDVDRRGAAATAEMCGTVTGEPAEYAIPADNPHRGTSNTCDEIWLHGFRNPWRFSFDRATGDLWIGDVGQFAREEIDLRAADSAEPLFYGWHCMEGTRVFNTAGICQPPLPPNVLPVIDYALGNSRCAVTGGYRFRGPIRSLQGMYLFADSCSSEILFAKPADGAGWTTSVWRDDPNGYGTYSGFGEDEAGRLYVAHTSGDAVYRITSQAIMTGSFD